ncbi:MAG: sigma-70 family RNA polymerase sigma factor [Longimicrobiales bacterium]|nr:sigma-70 family RNA polymerase sigma factor [Longimicrobiales bacterium]
MDYDELFTRYYPALHRYSFRLTGDVDEADDVAQEAFVRMIRRSVTGEPSALRSWLFRTALNLVRDRSRVRSNRQRLLKENPDSAVQPDEPEPPDRTMSRGEDVRRVRRVLQSLPERDRVLLVMKEEGFKYGEIAEAVGVAPGSVGTLLARAQERFAKAYREVHGGEQRSESRASDDR